MRRESFPTHLHSRAVELQRSNAPKEVAMSCFGITLDESVCDVIVARSFPAVRPHWPFKESDFGEEIEQHLDPFHCFPYKEKTKPTLFGILRLSVASIWPPPATTQSEESLSRPW